MRSPLYACLTFCFPSKIKLFFLGIASIYAIYELK